MKERIKVVRLEYNLDDVLEYNHPLVDGEWVKSRDALCREKPVKEWYRENYNDDPLGHYIDEDLTWDALLERMRCREEVYGIIFGNSGVGDSIVRERIFGHLSKDLLLVPYMVLTELCYAA